MAQTAETKTGRRARRAAAVATMLGAMLVAGSSAAQAQTFGPTSGGAGQIWGKGTCRYEGMRGDVSVTAMNPYEYRNTGLVYYVQTFVKGTWETQWTLNHSRQTGTIKTWVRRYDAIGNYYGWQNNPTTLDSSFFTANVEGDYDVYIRYWFKTPTGSWSSARGFFIGRSDWSNGYFTSFDSWGYGMDTSTCVFMP